MAGLKERAGVKFCFFLEKLQLKLSQDEAMGKTQVVSKEVKCLLKINCFVASLPQAKLTKSDEKVCQAVLAECQRTTDEISEITGVSWSSYQHNVMDRLMMKRVAAQFVSCLFTEEQKNEHVKVCCDLQEELKNDLPFLTKVVKVMRVGAMAMTLSQSSSQSVEVTIFTQIKKSAASSLKCQGF
jgi:hypothetical protein